MRALAIAGLTLACACATTPVVPAPKPLPAVASPKPTPPPPVAPPPVPKPPPTVDRLAPVLALARSLVGHRRIVVRGRTFRPDCSGFVRAVFGEAGIDLFDLDHRPARANGVRLIHEWFEEHGELTREPRPGDVVFFDNTWDKDKDGRLDDRLTHVGLVDRVLADGTVYVIHAVARGVVDEPMNLARPHAHEDDDGREINAWLRRRSARDRKTTPHLMGELFAGFGALAPEPVVTAAGPKELDPADTPPDDDDLPPPPIPPAD